MGSNAAFSQFEHFTIATYDAGSLTKDLLSKFMEFYRGVDIDHGGMRGTLTNDGLDVEQVVLKVFEKACPEKPDLPLDRKTWTKEQSQVNEDYWDARDNALYEVSKSFGWS